MLLRMFSQHPSVTCSYQAIKGSLRENGEISYDIIDASNVRTPFVINKETLGPYCLDEAIYPIFRNPSDVKKTKPIFLFRDPVRTWNGWIKQGWKDFTTFQIAYLECYKWLLYANAIHGQILCVTYEELTEFPSDTLKRICYYWGLGEFDCRKFEETGDEWLSKIISAPDFKESTDNGVFDHAIKSQKIEKASNDKLIVTQKEIDFIRASPLNSVYHSIKNFYSEFEQKAVKA